MSGEDIQVEHSPIIAALCAVSEKVRGIRATGRNDHQRYDYVSDADLTRAVRKPMRDNGLVLAPSTMSYAEVAGSLVITVEWTLHHTGGETLSITTIGEGKDKQDKAAYKAMTGARKYALRLLFNLATGDDAEQDSPGGSLDLDSLPSDPSFTGAESSRFHGMLNGIGLKSDAVTKWCHSRGQGSPRTYTQERRLKFERALLRGDIPDLYQPDAGRKDVA